MRYATIAIPAALVFLTACGPSTPYGYTEEGWKMQQVRFPEQMGILKDALKSRRVEKSRRRMIDSANQGKSASLGTNFNASLVDDFIVSMFSACADKGVSLGDNIETLADKYIERQTGSTVSLPKK